MGEKGQAFVKGGCGCLLAFGALALAALIFGGSFNIDLGGAACLFVTDGLIGLLVLMI